MFRTEDQQKKLCKSCPLAKTANLIGDGVVLLIVRELLTGPKRFKDIEQALGTISTRTITDKLHFLEEEKILTREEYREVPPKVEYSLTKKGEALKEIFDTMAEYGEAYLTK
jgi:DNA-binding HxlR family transcriptional regulator